MKFILTAFLTFLFFTLSSQWDRQHPFNHIGVINDININGDQGVAVGDDATLFLSTDGGLSWEIINNDLNGWNFSSGEINENTIYACGRGIYKSEDGGSNFDELINAPEEIFDSYLSENGNLIVCNNKGVFKSEDGGNSFINLNTPVDSLGTTSFILDENHIWWTTAGNDPVLYITTDGGQTWESNTALSRPKKMAFFDQNKGIASDLPYFYYTEDGGRTWTEKGRLSRTFGKIIFGSTSAEAYITSASNFYITQDTFATFEEMKSLFGASDLNGFYFNPSDSSYLIGASYSTIASSLDEGKTWTDKSGKLKPHITAMYSQNGQNVYAAGSKMILYTEDGGIDWKFLDTTAIPVRSMEISSEGNLILSGTQRINQKDLSTLEESTLYGPVPGIFQDFHITPSGRWITYNTTDYYLISEDNGVSWDSFYIDEFSNGIDKAYNDDLFIRIRGKLLQSNDEGTSWNEIYNASVARDIRALSVVDSTIYIMESTRNLRKSTDYGVSWDSLATPTGDPMIVTELHFINQDTGYLYDQTGGRLWYTFDGGETWPFAYFPKARLNGMYEFRNNDLQSTWLFGFGGFIEKQSDCKNPPLLSDIEGTVFPCILDTVTFSVNGSNIDKYFWSVPDEWEIVNDDNGSEITIYAIDPGVGYLTVYGENACGQTDALELQIAGTSIPDVELLDLGIYSEQKLMVNSFNGSKMEF